MFVDTRARKQKESLRQSNSMENEIHPPLFSMIHENLFKIELNNNNKYISLSLYRKTNRTCFIQIPSSEVKTLEKWNEK